MPTGPLTSAGALARRWSSSGRPLRLGALAVGLGIVAAAWLLAGHVPRAQVTGYPGVFFLSFLGSVSMVLPVPGLITLCVLSPILSPALLGALAALGETLGEVSGYAVGYGGGALIERRRFYPKLKKWMEVRGTVVLFLVSLIPNPLFDLVGIAGGSVGFPLPRFLATVWVGKTLKGLIVGYTCSFGLDLLPWVQ